MRTVVVDSVDERLDGVVVRVPVAHAEQVGDLLLIEGPVAVEVELVELDPERLLLRNCLLYTSPSPRDGLLSRMPSSA